MAGKPRPRQSTELVRAPAPVTGAGARVLRAQDRQVVAEINELIDKARVEAGAEYNSRQLAESLIAGISRNDPTLLSAWLHLQAVELMRRQINLQDAAVRTHQRRVSQRAAFSDATAAARAGDPVPLTRWLETRYVVASGNRVSLGDMTKADLAYVIAGYKVRSQRNGLHAVFMEEIAKRLNTAQKVGEKFNEIRLAELWHSISKS